MKSASLKAQGIRAALICSVLVSSCAAQQDLSGTSGIRFALAKLNVLGSVLMIAAHPDDENNAVLAYCSRREKARTGYLSCTRGEGGQNLIGPEQGEYLGVLRTQELLAARHVDGASQFFTRAIDFGFTLSPVETIAKWGHDRILSDMVWVIRQQRPDVVILCFSGTPADGHGQHQASAILGREAYEAAADPKRFPEQLKWLEPWKPARLMRSTFRSSKEAGQGKFIIDAGEYNPVLGRSYQEIATLSRNEHKSQAMVNKLSFGASPFTLITVDGKAPSAGLFDGVDASWKRIAGTEMVASLLGRAAGEFDDLRPENTVPRLLEARNLIAAMAKTEPWARWKLDEVDAAVALCAGLRAEVEADRAIVHPGGKLVAQINVLNRSHLPIRLTGIHLSGWENRDVVPAAAELPYNQPSVSKVEIGPGPARGYSQPFWLAGRHTGNFYDVQDQQLIGRADIVPELTAQFDFECEGVRFAMERHLRFRYADPASGEYIRPVAVEPPIAVELRSKNLVVPLGAPREISVAVRTLFGKAAGSVTLDLPAAWKVEPAAQTFALRDAGEVKELRFMLSPPAAQKFGRFRAVAKLDDGQEIATGVEPIAYTHIPTQTVFSASEGSLDAVPLRVTAKRVGYVMGSQDAIPDALRQMGVEVDLLSEKDLTSGDLRRYDAIVTGVRAQAVRADLRANRERLLDYVRKGGTMIVQYNKNSDRSIGPDVVDALDHLGPYPMKFGDNKARVTQEDAPVKILDQKSPLLHYPNEITAADFEGWVQERGLYFATTWDPRYSTVIESHDQGDPDLPGGLLYTRYGKGVYIFTAYSWFRELPAGVPGAYRLFANLLSAR